MDSVISYFKKRPHLLILGLIIVTGIFLRSYKTVERFEFAHDGDLYSWIVKDIVINHHPRLIGQLTSAPGIFIGGLFYYLLIPFFLLTKMDPLGVIYFAILIGTLTIFSYYYVLSRLFKIEVGLIAASLYATLLTTVNADRWVVPTITTNLWVIWYFYTVIKIARGDYKVLALLGILIGLIWYVHIALLPVLIAVPFTIVFAKKLPNIKQIIQFCLSFLITSLPFIIFEIKHGFGQISSLIANFQTPREGAEGIFKLTLILNMITKNTNVLLFDQQTFFWVNNILMVIIIFSAFWLVWKQVLLQKELLIFLMWIMGVIVFFEVSSSPISEYYFSNIGVIFITIISLCLYFIFKSTKIGKILVAGLLMLIAIKNSHSTITQTHYQKGYVERKAVANYIKKDVTNRGFPCVGINYITAIGENVGFRYFFYLNNLHLVHPSVDIPVYNIVIPDEFSPEVQQKFGHIGIIPPTSIPTKETILESCKTPNTNLTDPMFGYTD